MLLLTNLYTSIQATYHQADQTARVLRMLDVPLMQLGPHR